MSSSTSNSPPLMAGFVATAAFAILLEIAPLGLSAGSVSAPDLTAAFVFFWVLRRPEAAPVLLVCFVAITRDLLAGGPVGAGALALVLGAEAVRSRDGARAPLYLELMMFAVFALVTNIGAWFLVWITAGGAPSLSAVLARAAITVACYPAVYLIFRSLLRIRSREAVERGAAGNVW